jgi:transcriptional regulator with XRE-family HTH domain
MSSKTTPAPFSVRLRTLRREAGLTQRALAEAAGLSPNYVARLERGELAPSLDTAARLAGALGVEVPDFFAAG